MRTSESRIERSGRSNRLHPRELSTCVSRVAEKLKLIHALEGAGCSRIACGKRLLGFTVHANSSESSGIVAYGRASIEFNGQQVLMQVGCYYARVAAALNSKLFAAARITEVIANRVARRPIYGRHPSILAAGPKF